MELVSGRGSHFASKIVQTMSFASQTLLKFKTSSALGTRWEGQLHNCYGNSILKEFEGSFFAQLLPTSLNVAKNG
jgi:hypothetical protein